MPLFLFELFMCTFGITSIKDKASSLVVYVIFLNIEIFGGIVPETRRTITCTGCLRSGKVRNLGYLVRKNDNFSKSQDFGDQSQEFATMLKLHVESHPET